MWGNGEREFHRLQRWIIIPKIEISQALVVKQWKWKGTYFHHCRICSSTQSNINLWFIQIDIITYYRYITQVKRLKLFENWAVKTRWIVLMETVSQTISYATCPATHVQILQMLATDSSQLRAWGESEKVVLKNSVKDRGTARKRKRLCLLDDKLVNGPYCVAQCVW